MGTKVLRDSPYNLAEIATRSMYESMDILRGSSASLHDRLRLLSYCIVPSINYGPLVDAYPGPQSYREIDATVIAEIGRWLRITNGIAQELALAPRTAFGLGLILPHHYHADMQKQAHAMKAGTFRELRKAKSNDHAPLRSFLTLALSRGPPLSDGQIHFIGDCLAGRYQKPQPFGTCRHCKQPMSHRHHLVCKSINGLHVERHNRIVALLTSGANGKSGKIMKYSALPINHLQPDLIIEDGFGDVVVAAPWRVEFQYKAKMTKYIPLQLQGRAAFFLPVVIGGDGTLHPSTASGLARLGVDLLKFRQGVSEILLWHFEQTAMAYARLPIDAPLPPPAVHVAKAPSPCSPPLEQVNESPEIPVLRQFVRLPPKIHQEAAPLCSPQRRPEPARECCPPEDCAPAPARRMHLSPRKARPPTPLSELSHLSDLVTSSTVVGEPLPKHRPPIFKRIPTRTAPQSQEIDLLS